MRLSRPPALSTALILILVISWSHGKGTSHQSTLKSARVPPRSNTNATSKVEEKVSYMGSCYERADQLAPIVFREAWNSEVELKRLNTPVELVVIKDGGHNCISTSNCLAQMKLMSKYPSAKRCETRENFYVGGDGKVYEGRGWDFAPYWFLNGLRQKSITVQFLGSHKSTKPSPVAMDAFEAATEIGLWLGKLSKTYNITSFKQLHRENTVHRDALSQNPTRSDRWIGGEELSNFWEYTIPGRLRFVFRRKWNASRPAREFDPISRPVDYVAISEGGDNCFNQSDCISKMQAIQAEHIKNYGDLMDNFYIGDEGEVYEGRGWNYSPLWFIKGLEKKKYISVRFFGSYENNEPTQKVLNSLKLLVQTGVSLGIVSPGFRIFSLRQIYNQSLLLGSCLRNIARKWSVWSDLNSFNLTSKPTGPNFFMSRQEWDLKSVNTSYSNNSLPIKYVMITNGGTQCSSVELCRTSMRLEQNNSLELYGGLLENFYAGDDGVVYEGRGWNSTPFLNTPFFNNSLISVKFLGSIQTPSRPAWLAFTALLDAGVDSRKISSNYKLYSFRHIYNSSFLLGDEIARRLERQPTWDRNLSLLPEKDRLLSGVLPIYELTQPSKTPSSNEYSSLHIPLDYVVVGDSGQQCFTHEECRNAIFRMKAGDSQDLGNLSYNFYVGEDGGVYADRGWKSTCYWHVRGVRANSIFVSFLGNFESSLPSQYAFLALKLLVQHGVRIGKLSSKFQIISISQLYPNSTHAGTMLVQEIESLYKWSKFQAVSPGGVHIPFGTSAIVPRSQWNERSTGKQELELLSYPAPYVIILDAEESCTNREDCIERVIAERRRTHLLHNRTMENFYIGEDGRIYEGQGWHLTTEWHWKILNIDYITVAFLGKFRSETPSSKALTAFEYFLKESVMTRKLKADYSIFSLRQFLPEERHPGDALDEYVRKWEHWSNDTSVGHVTDEFEILFPAMWGKTRDIRKSVRIIHPLKYVFVRDGGRPCTGRSECSSCMKEIEKDKNGITENFYVGGLGKVFIGVGWEYDTMWGYEGWRNSISVQFLGNYETSLPNKDALEAFTALCRYGVRRGYIDSNYKILYIPDGFDSRNWIGFKLKQLVKSWKMWIPNVNAMK